MGYAGDDSKYCCGPVVINNGSLGCKVGDPFQIDKGSVLLGVAALAGYSNSTSTSTSTSNNCTPADDSSDKDCPTAEPSTSHDVAIGAGVGVPLGVIALASIVWALWERRQRKQALQSISAPVAVGHPNIGYNPSQGVYRRPPVELSTAPVSELDGSGNGEMK
ncbi:uncharacterized protein ACLA_041200 [Aspergillus clavatus NRRL 1]|uniref:Uncharacterized protein n=1 Tax=Aspergillus clavatus (strain ATCC 1007 / CBS 513.65 / DSM 816 / NCTC 3887 / NRRL 1 / QM 1276 / 107) TaxID=344612 RepID=A1CL80_ASPCL|nr:uncharacterized protein ACLA_041200 [Aspergillus clavatus NRRL 1]EAW09904.1 conserved hypothetical protein [Aspergillus clavatus NRRL 1]